MAQPGDYSRNKTVPSAAVAQPGYVQSASYDTGPRPDLIPRPQINSIPTCTTNVYMPRHPWQNISSSQSEQVLLQQPNLDKFRQTELLHTTVSHEHLAQTSTSTQRSSSSQLCQSGHHPARSELYPISTKDSPAVTGSRTEYTPQSAVHQATATIDKWPCTTIRPNVL